MLYRKTESGRDYEWREKASGGKQTENCKRKTQTTRRATKVLPI